jgi:hypothetical protein
MAISVAANKWPYTHKLPKDPDAVLDYQLDWSDWLAEGESIAALAVTVTGLVLETSAFTATATTAWVSGGVVGALGEIEFRITTDSAPLSRVDDRTLILRIAER